MARMIPREFDGARGEGEERVYHALRERLPDSYTVFYSVDWVRAEAGGAAMSETDFVVLSPEHGLLPIEVKGGRIERNGSTGAWFSTNRHDARFPIDNPVRQARNSMGKMRDLAVKAGVAVPQQVCHSHAVWFPDVTSGRIPPLPDLQSEFLLTLEDCEDPGRGLLRAWNFFGQKPPGSRLTPEEFSRMVEAFSPSFAVAPSLAAQVRIDEAAFVRLTQGQHRSLSLLSRVRRALITGCAGSGKTLLAIEKARLLAGDGASVLLVCFNRFLAEFLRQRMTGVKDRVTVHSFETLCRDMCLKAGIEWSEPDAGPELHEFWDATAPDLLDRAVEKLGTRFDAVVVDEGQDFSTRYWASLEKLLQGQANGVLFVFIDPKQDIFNKNATYPVGLQGPFPLVENCRNTAAICRLMGRLSDAPVQHPESSPEGVAPFYRACASRRDQKEAVQRIIEEVCGPEGLAPERVAILSCRSSRHSALKDEAMIGRFRIARDKFPCPPGEILLTSLHRFKGLEADVVLVIDIDKDSRTATDLHLYVAVSRARHRVYLIGSDEAMQRLTAA